MCANLTCFARTDPNLLNELSARLDDAERKYMEADLEERLKELEEAKQRQVAETLNVGDFGYLISFYFGLF